MPGFELIGKEEKKEIDSIFKNGGVLFRHGFDNIRNNTYKVAKFEKSFAKKFKSKYALAVTSGTAALRVALSILDLKKGDEIITQSFTFVATVESIIESRAIPICIEIDKSFGLVTYLNCFLDLMIFANKNHLSCQNSLHILNVQLILKLLVVLSFSCLNIRL